MPPTLHLILAEAALELVPPELWSHPAVSKPARTRGKKASDTLLDDTYHHAAMSQAAKKGKFPDFERRGRPDIVHATLLVALESRLNKEGRLQVWVHTHDDRLLWFRPDVRLQRAQHRFYGLMERLLLDGTVPQGAKGENLLISAESDVTLADAVRRLEAERVVVFDETGEDRSVESALAEGVTDGNVVAVIGAYPTGAFRSDLSFPHEKVALGNVPLTAWSVAAEAVVRFRAATGGA